MDFCNLSLTGRLTRDPEVKVFSGKSVVKFAVAYNYGIGDKRRVSYLDCESWEDKKVEFIQKYLKTGSRVTLNGRLEQDNWENKEGQKQSKHFMKVSDVYFADSLPKKENSEAVSESPDAPF